MQFSLFKEGGVKNTELLWWCVFKVPFTWASQVTNLLWKSIFWKFFWTSNTKSVLIFTNNSTQCIQLLVGLWWLFNESIPSICQVILYGLLWESDISDKIPVCSLSRMDPLFNPCLYFTHQKQIQIKVQLTKNW